VAVRATHACGIAQTEAARRFLSNGKVTTHSRRRLQGFFLFLPLLNHPRCARSPFNHNTVRRPAPAAAHPRTCTSAPESRKERTRNRKRAHSKSEMTALVFPAMRRPIPTRRPSQCVEKAFVEVREGLCVHAGIAGRAAALARRGPTGAGAKRIGDSEGQKTAMKWCVCRPRRREKTSMKWRKRGAIGPERKQKSLPQLRRGNCGRAVSEDAEALSVACEQAWKDASRPWLAPRRRWATDYSASWQAQG